VRRWLRSASRCLNASCKACRGSNHLRYMDTWTHVMPITCLPGSSSKLPAHMADQLFTSTTQSGKAMCCIRSWSPAVQMAEGHTGTLVDRNHAKALLTACRPTCRSAGCISCCMSVSCSFRADRRADATTAALGRAANPSRAASPTTAHSCQSVFIHHLPVSSPHFRV
jgi:hypothetical protein